MTDQTGYRLGSTVSPAGRLICRLTSEHPDALIDPVLCFSLLIPGEVISGGTLLEATGGFHAIRLWGRLSAQCPLEFEIGFANPRFKPANRAGLPLGIYLRLGGGATVAVEGGPAGVIPKSPELRPLAGSDTLALVPPPGSWRPAGGKVALKGLRLAGQAAFAGAFQAADRLAVRSGLGPLMTDDGLETTVQHDAELGAEAYHLTLNQGTIAIRAGGRAGAFHAAVTLMTLRRTHDGKVPAGTIIDSPRFEWRGQHLDCARHYYQPRTIRRLLDLMALLKLNRFHWHFADDEAFRLEVDCAPDLWRESVFRGEGQTIPGVFGGGAGPTGGSYCKAEARALIAHAGEIGIEILPEIEFPAHALSTARIYPALRDPDDTGTEASVQAYTENVVNPALDETWSFFGALCAEVSALFPFGHLHLGGDELPPDTWGGSPLVAEMKARHGLATHVDVQGFAMQRLASELTASGIVPCAWEEAALGSNGGIGNGALLFSWTAKGPGLEAARRGYDIVMCPAQHTYLDMAHSGEEGDWGANWAATFGLEGTIAWDPVPADEPDLARRIRGIEGAYWSEFTTEDRQIEAMIAPRILGIAAKAWSPRDGLDIDRLSAISAEYMKLFEALDWQTAWGARQDKLRP